jgi:ankyrin repeat protein
MGVQGLQHRNDDGLTLLHIAAGADEESKVEFLLTHGLKPHVKSPDGATPLMYCALRNSPGVMRMLLQYMRGQGLDETDQSGRTALHYAMAQNTPDNVLALRTLLLAGANPTSVDEKGRTPRIKAEKNGFVACVSIFDVSM